MKKIVCVVVFCFWAMVANAKLMDLSHFELDNGLQVVVIENHKAPIVLQMLYYKTGSVNDPSGKGGIAHLLEHLMFRGTKQVPDREFNRLTDVYGASNNAYTTYNETGYYEFSDISKLELMMALEADRMQNLAFSKEAFVAERDIVLQERMQRFESNPVPLFYETLNKILWQGSPLANPVSGAVSEIKALTAEDAWAFYRHWYRPNNALLVLAGDITVKEAKVLANKYYGDIRNSGEILREDFEPARVLTTELEMMLQNVEQPRYVSLLRLEKGMFSKAEILALEIIAEYLAGDDTAYLYDKLVYQNKKFLSVGADVSYNEALGGTFLLYLVPADEAMSLKEIDEVLAKELEDSIHLLTEEKLEKIKNQMLSEIVYMQENPESSARFVGNMFLQGYSAEDIINLDKKIKEIGVQDVINVWEKMQAMEAKVTGYLRGM